MVSTKAFIFFHVEFKIRLDIGSDGSWVGFDGKNDEKSMNIAAFEGKFWKLWAERLTDGFTVTIYVENC